MTIQAEETIQPEETIKKDIRALFESGMKAFADNAYEESETYFTQVLETSPEFRLAWESRGAARLRLQRTEAAIADFERAIALSPERSRPYHLRGLAYEQKGDLNQAINDFNQAILLEPEYVAAYHSRSILRSRRGETERAEKDLQTFKMLTEKKLETFSNEHNIWRSAHLAVEDAGATDVLVDR